MISRNVQVVVSLLACFALSESLQGQGATPEEAVLAGMRGFWKSPVVLEPRAGFTMRAGGGATEFGARRTAARTQELARALDADIQDLDNVLTCSAHDAARGEYPWSRCRLVGAETLIAVSEASVEGDEATVYVMVWNQRLSNKIQPISMTQWKATARREGRGWRLTGQIQVATT